MASAILPTIAAITSANNTIPIVELANETRFEMMFIVIPNFSETLPFRGLPTPEPRRE